MKTLHRLLALCAAISFTSGQPLTPSRAHFDRMPFDALLGYAATHAAARSFIVDHYLLAQFRVHEKLIVIGGVDKNPAPTTIAADDIAINSLEIALRSLHVYGDRITRLTFSAYFYNSTNRDAIVRLIKDRCAGTLVEFNLLEFTPHVVLGPMHFGRVQRLSIDTASVPRFSVPWTFDRLEEFKAPAVLYTKWTAEIIAANAGLKVIALPLTEVAAAIELLGHVQKPDELTELELRYTDNGDGGHFAALLDTFKGLQRITFHNFWKLEESAGSKAIASIVAAEWGHFSVCYKDSRLIFAR